MANKRDLKRTINYITSELFAETVAASLYNGKPSQEDVDGILSAIVMINGDYISRVSHPEPGIKKAGQQCFRRECCDSGEFLVQRMQTLCGGAQ